MKRAALLNRLIALIFGGLLISATLAQTTGYGLPSWVVGGGGQRAAGSYELADTSGQSAAGRITGGSYILETGFEALDDSGLVATPGTGPDRRRAYMPLIERVQPTPTPTLTPTPTEQPLPLCNEIEPDNNYNNKVPPFGTIGQVCLGSFENAAGDKVDLYKITPDTQHTISIDLTNIPNQADYTLALYDSRLGRDPSAPPICRSKTPGSADEHIVYPNAARGIYYVGVFLAYRSSADPNTYHLRVSWDENPASCQPPT